MVAGMWNHLSSLRKMKQDDRGWIKTLLDEAENERMHLMIFIEIAKPNSLERAIVLLAQFLFLAFLFHSVRIFSESSPPYGCLF